VRSVDVLPRREHSKERDAVCRSGFRYRLFVCDHILSFDFGTPASAFQPTAKERDENTVDGRPFGRRACLCFFVQDIGYVNGGFHGAYYSKNRRRGVGSI